MSTTTIYGFQKFFQTWLEQHPGQGLVEMLNAILDNVDSTLSAALAVSASTSIESVAVRATDTSAPITQKTGTVVLTKGSAGAWTLAAPTASTDDGKVLTLLAGTAFAHTVITPANKLNGNKTTVTYAAVGDSVVLEAYNGVWLTRALTGALVS